MSWHSFFYLYQIRLCTQLTSKFLLVYYRDVKELLNKLGIEEYIQGEWRLFVNCSKSRLKCVIAQHKFVWFCPPPSLKALKEKCKY